MRPCQSKTRRFLPHEPQAIVSEPSSYARKVFTQLGYFFFPDEGTFFRTRIQMGKLYEYVLTTVPESLDAAIGQPVREMFADYRQSVEAQEAHSATLEVFRPFRSFLRGVRPAAIWIEVGFLLSLVICLFSKPLAALRLPGLLAALFFLAPASNAVTIALIHALDNSRYRGSYGPLLLFALAGMFVFAITTLACAAKISFGRRSRDQFATAD